MKKKVGIISLGCDKNLIDTEKMLGLLSDNQFEITNSENLADILIVNTCGFIESAVKESIDTIKEMAEIKEKDSSKLLIVTGCLAQRKKEELLAEIPQIDAILGTGSYNEIANAIKECTLNKKVLKFDDVNKDFDIDMRIQSTPKYTAYLKIAEGCSNNCTYCIIPRLRGKYRSRSVENILNEANKLAKNGVKELIVIAQDITKFGIDNYKKKMLPTLLNELCKIEGIEWIRLLYCYPEGIDEELISVIKSQEKICKYIDIPMQHCNDEILRKMGRRSNRKNLENLIKLLRKEVPSIIIRTSLIVGFPGETDEQFEDLLDFINKMKLNRVGVFKYSKEEDTKAATYENQIDDNIKEQRLDKLMQLQQKISLDNNTSFIDKTIKVLVEGMYKKNRYFGRSYMDSPDIDGKILFKSEKTLNTGEFVQVKILKVNEYDMIGEIIDEFSK